MGCGCAELPPLKDDQSTNLYSGVRLRGSTCMQTSLLTTNYRSCPPRYRRGGVANSS